MKTLSASNIYSIYHAHKTWNALNCVHLNIYEHDEFQAYLSWA